MFIHFESEQDAELISGFLLDNIGRFNSYLAEATDWSQDERLEMLKHIVSHFDNQVQEWEDQTGCIIRIHDDPDAGVITLLDVQPSIPAPEDVTPAQRLGAQLYARGAAVLAGDEQ